MSAGPGWDTLIGGDVSERPKELASKASVVQATVGSNPTVTATVALLEPPVPAPGVSALPLPGRSPARHPPAPHHRSASLPVVRRSPRRERQLYGRPLVFPTGTLALRTNACATAQAYDRKASESAGKVREVAAPSGNACLLVVCWPSRRLPVFPASACLPGGNACLAGECLRYSAGV